MALRYLSDPNPAAQFYGDMRLFKSQPKTLKLLTQLQRLRHKLPVTKKRHGIMLCCKIWIKLPLTVT